MLFAVLHNDYEQTDKMMMMIYTLISTQTVLEAQNQLEMSM